MTNNESANSHQRVSILEFAGIARTAAIRIPPTAEELDDLINALRLRGALARDGRLRNLAIKSNPTSTR